MTDLTADETALQGPFSVFKANVDSAIASIEKSLDIGHVAPSIAPDDALGEEHTISSTKFEEMEATAENPSALSIMMPTRPMIHLLDTQQSAKPRVEELFSHYMLQVADVIQVIGHPHNMFRSVYAQYALQILAHPSMSSTPQTMFASHKAIFCAIISTSAFHLRGLNSHELDRWELYNQIGMAYRLRALQYMRYAIMEPFIDAETHCAKLSAILTLVDLDASIQMHEKRSLLMYLGHGRQLN